MWRSLTCLSLLSLVACAPRLERGSPCTRESDCPTELACLNGRCLEECLQQADCDFPARCVSVGGLGRCLFDTENLCTSAADCGGAELVCQAGHCFNTCERCADLGALCEDGVCVRVETVDGGSLDAAVNDAGLGDAGLDAGRRDGGGAPVFEPHVPCVDAADCAEGEACASDDGATPVCRVPCIGPIPDAGPYPMIDGECASRMCVRPADDFSVAYCALTCDPLDPSSCPAGEACDRMERLRPTTGDPRNIWGCRVVASPQSEVDGPCNTSVPERCPSGTRCYAAAGIGDGLCLPFCNDTTSSCLGDRTCFSSHDDQYPVGLCLPRAMPDAGP